MRTASTRLGALIAIVVLVGACAGAVTTATPGAPTSAATPGGPTQATTSAPAATAGTADLRWYCCLGTGEDPSQVPTEEEVAAGFAEAHPGSSMKFEVVTYDAARDALSTQIAAGNAPDIVGPAGVGGLAAFEGQWLDLAPLIEKYGYDLSQYDEGAVNFYKTDEGQVGIPYAIYPSMLWYKADLFEEAGLELPPATYGEQYTMPDGSQVEWNYDTIREIAMILTVDENGNDATSPDFNPEAIVQYGFDPQRDDLRGLGAYFGAGSLVGADGTTVEIPQAWADGWKFFYSGMWEDHFIPTGPVAESEEFSGGGYTFFSGRVAMNTNFLWIKYGVADAGTDWNLAALPSHNGQVTSPLNADTFGILKGSKNPDVAFQGLTYLQDNDELLQLYGAFPAAKDKQDPFFETLDQTEGFPEEVNWQVVKDSVQYADNPNFEAAMPKYNETLEVLGKYNTKWTTTPGLDMDAEIQALRDEIQATWDS